MPKMRPLSSLMLFYKIKNFDIDDLSSSEIEKFTIPVGKAQIEAVKIIDESSFWITSEDEGNGLPRLFKFKKLAHTQILDFLQNFSRGPPNFMVLELIDHHILFLVRTHIFLFSS